MGSNMDLRASHVREVGGLDFVRVQPPAQVVLEQSVEKLDVLGQGRGELLARAVVVGHGDAAHEFAVIQGVVDLRAGGGPEVRVLDLLPEAEELGHGLDEPGGLRAEDHAQLADGLSPAAVQLHLVLDRGAVLVLQRAFERHGKAVRREEGHQIARGAHQLLDGGEHVVDAALGRGIVHILGQDLVDEVGAVGAHAVGQRVHLPHDLVVEHQAVEGLFHSGSSFRKRGRHEAPCRRGGAASSLSMLLL